MLDQLLGLLLFGLGLNTSPITGAVKGEATEVREIKKNQIEERKENRETQREELKEAREVRKEEMQETREQKREALKAQREDLKENIKAKREEAKEQFKAKREEFKQKLQTLKDEKKKQIVERIDAKMGQINTNRTNRMSEQINKMSEILERVITRAGEAKVEGKDTSAVDAAVATAQSAISAAQSAIATQAGQEYVATITTEEALKNTVGSSMKQLESDLKATHELIIAAKKAVMAAVEALAHVVGQATEVTPTP